MKFGFINKTVLFSSIFLSFNFYSQNFRFTYQYKVDSMIGPLLKGNDETIDSVVNFVNRTFSTEKEKVRAYYSYISLTIAYDVAHLRELEMYAASGFENHSKLSISQAPEETFKSKKAVCEGISRLMCKFCEGSGIKAELVGGYAKDLDGRVPKVMHAWNAVKVDSVWKLVDITWSNGYVNENGAFVRSFSNKYFFPEPDRMIYDHLPLDPMWQLSDRPITKSYFAKRDTSKGKYYSVSFNFNDSINKFILLPKPEKQIAEYRNYTNYDSENMMYAQALDVEVNNAAVIYMENAGTYLNEANTLYNNKIRFVPTKKDCNKALDLMDKAMKELKKAKTILENNQPRSEQYKASLSKTKEDLATNFKIHANNLALIKQQKKRAFK